ncbi:hypothetical protein BC829DRAFT_416857 [Chytridium lagenaria]|nr:hypothetical protein BC829DRAFT_416857 [Chytridium lagenaria]
MRSSRSPSWLMVALLAWTSFMSVVIAQSDTVPITINQKVLILATNDGLEESPIYTLLGYSIPYTVLNVPIAGISGPLPLEASNGTEALYNLIVLTNGGLSGDVGGGVFRSLLTDAQWAQIYEYQYKYNVRLIALNDIPGNAGSMGYTARAYGTWGTSDEHTISLTSAELGNRAGLKTNFQLPTTGLFHIPGTIVNSSAVTPFLSFSTLGSAWPEATIAGVIYNITDGPYPREQMSFFLPFGSWSSTCLIISHLWVQWGTRGTYNGFRRIIATATDVRFRTSTADMDGVIAWSNDFNSRLPSGSSFKLELAFNGNGILESVDQIKKTAHLIDFNPDLTDAPLDWKKPLGTGISLWSNPPPNRNAYINDLSADPLFSYFKNSPSNTQAFFWNSHTFTHEILNNNTYQDTINELTFNYHMAQQIGLTNYPNIWSNESMVTPGISGFFNGDALKALMDFGIKAAVGDSSRPKTLNSSNPVFWPMITTVEANGYAGFIGIPRSATNIYFNLQRDLQPGNPGQFSFDFLVKSDVDRVTRLLVGLSWMPYMFHQANLRTADAVPLLNPGTGTTAPISLLAYWVESVFSNLYKYVTWPVLSLKSDDFTRKFNERALYENCGVRTYFTGVRNTTTGKTFVSSLKAESTNTCTAPFTVPVARENVVVTGSTYTFEQIGTDPLTIWIPMAPGKPVTIQILNSVTLL